MFLGIDDFEGKYELHTGMYDQAKILEYIQIYEERYLLELLGAKLYDEFIADLDVNNYPESPNFQAIFNPFHEDAVNHGIVISQGILEMLKGFIYFEYIKDTANQMTINGQVIPQNENSLTATSLYNMMYTRYWEALRTYRAIQWYICTNNDLPIGTILEVELTDAGNGYDGYYWLSNLTQGTGTGGVLEMTSWQMNGIRTLSPASIGSGYTDNTIYPLFGLNGGTVLVGTTPSGVPNSIEIVDAGSGYSVGDVVTIDGGNDDQTFTVTSVANGELQSVGVYEGGKNYSVGDTFTLTSNTHPNIGDFGTATCTKVTTGDFKKWNGVRKQMAYWL